ncbi:MAG: right-handed parallel beta-helix repeat-containing protein [Pirellulales bacterium]|nr:right-handed parallel beta-helix repeat-containing protein [Pirellulales bacterium]
MSKTTLLIVMAGFLLVPVKASAAPVEFLVAPNGNDIWSGSIETPNAQGSDGPLATMAGARDTVRKWKQENELPEGGIRVVVRGGTYTLDRPLGFSADDSGTKDRPIVYQAKPGETVRLLGGRVVTKWRPVTDQQVRAKLDPVARNQVRQADLKGLGITDFGSPLGGGIELFFDNKPMTVARWPNQGFVRVVDVLGKTQRNVRSKKGCVEGVFAYEGDRPSRWGDEPNGCVHGYWFWDWADERHAIISIDPEHHRLEVAPPFHNYGYRKGQWFYAFNLQSELDQPGEWYLDRQHGILYFWPPTPIEQGEAIVSVLPTIVTMNDISHVTLRGFIVEGARGDAIAISGGEEGRIVGCTIRNVGGWAVRVAGGRQHSVVGCDMYQMGRGGIALSGGDRTTLTPAGHVADNNHIHHYARTKRVYQPGITLQGVGNRASHNLIHDAPHMGMGFGGNNHRIELNEIHHVCQESNDAGAIYTGRNWTMRGTVIRHNYLHDISGFEGRGCMGIYLDDMFCGTEISGNVFYRVTRAAFIGGGRDCLVANNLFVDCRPALHVDARALGWAHDHSDRWIQEGREKGTLSGIRFAKPPYSTRYPGLADMLDDEPAAPKGNRVVHNVSVGGKWDGVHGNARKYLTLKDNLVDVDPHFTTPDRLGEGKHPRPTDFALKTDSPAWSVGFQTLPLEKIGLYEDDARASWPAAMSTGPSCIKKNAKRKSR